MDIIGKTTSIRGEFPIKELERLPASSLQYHTDLREVLQSKKHIQLPQKKKLLLTLRVIPSLFYYSRVCLIQLFNVKVLLKRI